LWSARAARSFIFQYHEAPEFDCLSSTNDCLSHMNRFGMQAEPGSQFRATTLHKDLILNRHHSVSAGYRLRAIITLLHCVSMQRRASGSSSSMSCHPRRYERPSAPTQRNPSKYRISIHQKSDDMRHGSTLVLPSTTVRRSCERRLRIRAANEPHDRLLWAR